MAASRHFLLAGTGVAFLAFVLQLVGVVTPNWVKYDSHTHAGLWRLCGYSLQTREEVCLSWGTDTFDWLNASRVFGIMTISLMSSAASLGLMFAIRSGHARIVMTAALLCFLGVLSSVVSFAIFAAKRQDLLSSVIESKLDYSFGLCVTAAILSIIAGVLFIRSDHLH